MLRLNRLTLLLCACCCYLFSTAQTNNCSADFTYSAGSYYNTINFFAKDSLGKTQHWLFGDGTPMVVSTGGMQTHQYAKPGKYEVKHFIESPNKNCRDSLVKIINVEWADKCNAAYSFKKDTGTLAYHFFNNSVPYSALKRTHWSFGDGSSSDSLNPAHTFTKSGTYTVCLKIETASGCSSEHCEQLQVIDSSGYCIINAQFQSYKDSLDCKKVYFKNTSSLTSPNVQFSWKFGDGSASNDINPSHVYNQPGHYRVCLVSESGNNCRKEYCDTVVINCDSSCSAIARFEWKKDSSDCKKIYFANHSEHLAPNTRFAWKFGDGDGSDDANPAHTYSQPGIYQVCLVVTGANNCTKYYCDSVIAFCPDICNIKPSFSWKTADSVANKVNFTNLTIAPAAGVHYIWKFGDGSSSLDVNPSHVYTQPGKYTVCLVTETNKCRKEICQQIEIRACNITARFEKQRAAAKWNTVYFSNVTQPVNNIWQTYWAYGDGASSRDYNSFHQYDKPGVYNVCLKVISLSGCVSEYCDTVRIVKADSCIVNGNFSHYNSTTGSSNLKFEALYQSNTAAYTWSFGDSSAGNGRIVYHTYAKPGKYNVCVMVKDGNCSTSHCEIITVEQSPNGGRVAVFPNPAVNTISVDVKLDTPAQLSIRFMDGSGAVRSSFGRSGVSGSNRFTLPIEKLSQGLYMVEIKSSTGVWFTRFIKG